MRVNADYGGKRPSLLFGMSSRLVIASIVYEEATVPSRKIRNHLLPKKYGIAFAIAIVNSRALMHSCGF